jgi:hypothetical protein
MLLQHTLITSSAYIQQKELGREDHQASSMSFVLGFGVDGLVSGKADHGCRSGVKRLVSGDLDAEY